MNFILFFTLVIWVGVLEGSEDSDSGVRFLLPPRPPRIYARAPTGVGVTRVRAVYDEKRSASQIHKSDCDPQYYLVPLTKRNNTTDTQFVLDKCEGIIRTNRSVEKSVGDYYELKIVALNEENIPLATLSLVVEVTNYNNRSPSFIETPNHNSLEIFEQTEVGALVLKLRAKDDDQESYNSELYYFLQDQDLVNKDPWLYPTVSPLKIDPLTGEIRVARDLRGIHQPIKLYAGVDDGGSPHRRQKVKLTVIIKRISAPINVTVNEVRKTSALICWSPPEHGDPVRYILKYGSNSKMMPPLNLTTQELFTPIFHTVKRITHCYRLENLIPYTPYVVRINAWNEQDGESIMLKESLKFFTRAQVCKSSLCGNGICQESKEEPGYRCLCATGYYGHNCKLKDPCKRKGKRAATICYNGCLHAHGKQCLCTSALSEGECPLSSRCFSEPSCFTGGYCTSTPIKDFYCYCDFNFEGNYCPDVYKQDIMNSPRCDENVTYHEEGALVWPKTLAGGTVILPCPNDSLPPRVTRSLSEDYDEFKVQPELILPPPLQSRNTRSTQDFIAVNEVSLYNIINTQGVTRKCREKSNNLAEWLPPDLSSCRRHWDYPTTTTGAFTNPTTSTREMVPNNTEEVAKDLLEEEFNNFLYFTRDGNDAPGAISKIGESLDALLTSNLSLLEEEKKGASNMIFEALHDYAAKVHLNPGEQMSLETPNVVVETRFLAKEDIANEVSFKPTFQSEVDPIFPTREDSDSETNAIKDLHLTIPKEALDSIEEEEVRFQFVSFKDDRLFQSKYAHQKPLKMPVISASIINHRVKDLKTPILYNIPLPQTSNGEEFIPKCVFWDAQENRWSEKGLSVAKWNNKEVLCQSNHLTAFSVLLDPIAEPVDPQHQTAFTFITYAGLALSTASLLLTIITFALFRTLNRDRSGAIVMNLSIALLLLNLSFIGASNITPENPGCIPLGALLHYAVTASFTWMLIEALNMHSLLVTVFPSVETHFMAKRLGTGWGFPVVLVSIALIWNKEVYVNLSHQLCIISPISYKGVYYFTYFAPICIILAINCVVFLLVSRVLCRRRLGSTKTESPDGKPSHKRFPVTLAQIRGAITVVALLGVTWIAGALSVGSFRVVFQYIFCITTPLQGFIIFFVRVIQSAEARAAWYIFLTTGTRNKRHKHQLPSMRTNSSSQNTSSSNTQSTGFGTQKSVLSSAFKLARRLSLANENQQGGSSPFNSNPFARKGKSMGEKWSLNSFQIKRKNPPKEECDNQDNDAAQKFNQMYELYFQQDSSPAPLTPPVEDCKCPQDCLHAKNSLLGTNSIDLYTTDVIPFEKEKYQDNEEEQRQDPPLRNQLNPPEDLDKPYHNELNSEYRE